MIIVFALRCELKMNGMRSKCFCTLTASALCISIMIHHPLVSLNAFLRQTHHISWAILISYSIWHCDWGALSAHPTENNLELFGITKTAHLIVADILHTERLSLRGHRYVNVHSTVLAPKAYTIWHYEMVFNTLHHQHNLMVFLFNGLRFFSRSVLPFGKKVLLCFCFGSQKKRVAINYSMPNAFDNTRLINSRLSMKSYSKKKNFDFILGIYWASNQKSEIGSVHAILWHYFSSPPFHTFVHTKW